MTRSCNPHGTVDATVAMIASCELVFDPLSLHVERADFSTAHVDGTEELARVVTVVDALYTHLCSPAIVDEISAANQPGQSSGVVQGVFVGEARQLGFRDESKGLFSDYESSALRPDYYRLFAMAVGVTGP